jgi:hypothetical protein
MLNSDELGEKGEHQFGQICADAKLVCNKSTRDRTGWDYIVEFNFPNDGTTQDSLEKREKPLSCHVQVKTIWDHNDQIQMRLSSAEHLAKELKPAFVYVQKVNARLEFTGAHLIHVLDEPLAKILKRLRVRKISPVPPRLMTRKYRCPRSKTGSRSPRPGQHCETELLRPAEVISARMRTRNPASSRH